MNKCNSDKSSIDNASTDIRTTLAERGKRYGHFPDQAKISQALKEILWAESNWNLLEDDQKEALEIVCHKIARIMNGDPHYHDSYHDISGYITLVADRIKRDQDNSVSAVGFDPAFINTGDASAQMLKECERQGKLAAREADANLKREMEAPVSRWLDVGSLPNLREVFKSKYGNLHVTVTEVRSFPNYKLIAMLECDETGTVIVDKHKTIVQDLIAHQSDMDAFYQRWLRVI